MSLPASMSRLPNAPPVPPAPTMSVRMCASTSLFVSGVGCPGLVILGRQGWAAQVGRPRAGPPGLVGQGGGARSLVPSCTGWAGARCSSQNLNVRTIVLPSFTPPGRGRQWLANNASNRFDLPLFCQEIMSAKRSNRSHSLGRASHLHAGWFALYVVEVWKVSSRMRNVHGVTICIVSAVTHCVLFEVRP